MIKGRLELLRNFFREKGQDAILISKRENIHYFSGFTGDDSLLLITKENAFLITDFRYVEQGRLEAPQTEIVKHDKGIFAKTGELVKKSHVKKLAFEGESLSFNSYKKLQEQVSPVELNVSLSVDCLRRCKEKSELQLISRAMEIGDIAFKDILGYIRPGISELEVAARLEQVMRANGSQEVSFTTIVASGKRGSLPHGIATEKLINSGEFVTMDYGAVYCGYHSDMTRTVCVGRADEKMRNVYEAVLQAQCLGVSLVKAGISGQSVDAQVRANLAQGGYAQYFGHGLGHGVGLEIHEEPRLSTASKDILQESMVVTVEPGIYIPDWGGVRIEDTVVVEQDGCRILTKSSKELIELSV